MVQRILQPSEIESLDHVALPRVRLPARAELFSQRAQRLRQLADGHPIGAYLGLMATVADAQHAVAQSVAIPPVDPEVLHRAQQHCMPPLAPAGSADDALWNPALDALLDQLAHAGLSPTVRATLARLAAMPTGERHAHVQGLLAGEALDVALAPFLMAALQVAWTSRASQLAEGDVPMLDVATICPVCGTLPVASIVHIGGRYQGLRFLHCGLCATAWHMVRVKCTHCETTEGIAYYTADEAQGAGEGRPARAIKAESCEQCRTYCKIGYMENDPMVDPVADDLASLSLDLLMAEAGYARRSGNPLLWQPRED